MTFSWREVPDPKIRWSRAAWSKVTVVITADAKRLESRPPGLFTFKKGHCLDHLISLQLTSAPLSLRGLPLTIWGAPGIRPTIRFWSFPWAQPWSLLCYLPPFVHKHVRASGLLHLLSNPDLDTSCPKTLPPCPGLAPLCPLLLSEPGLVHSLSCGSCFRIICPPFLNLTPHPSGTMLSDNTSVAAKGNSESSLFFNDLAVSVAWTPSVHWEKSMEVTAQDIKVQSFVCLLDGSKVSHFWWDLLKPEGRKDPSGSNQHAWLPLGTAESPFRSCLLLWHWWQCIPGELFPKDAGAA